MKNTLTETQNPGKHRNNRAAACAVMICVALLVFGCTEILQRTDGSGTISADNLMPEALRIIRKGLTDNYPEIRCKAIEVVAATQRTELMPEVQLLLRDDFVPVRFTAALAVGDLEYHPAENDVRQLLKDQQDVRIAAAYAMDKLGYADSFGLISKAITSDDQEIRANAALLLGKIGDKRALEPLYWAMRDEDSGPKVMFQAAESIAMLGDKRIYSKLWTELISFYADDRVLGIRAMGALGTVDAQNALITMLYDEILEVRLAAAEQLGMLNDTAGEPIVIDVFTRNLTAKMKKQEIEYVRVRTALAIGQIGTASLVKYLPQLLKDKSKFVRIAAAKAVFQCMMLKRPTENSL